MLRGDFAAAWRISDGVLTQRRQQRVDCSRWPRHLQFIWTGESFTDQRVLVRCYHGLGDTIQFARFFEPLRARAREVIVWAQPALVSILESVRGVDRVLPLHDGAPDVTYDVDIESMELAHALRIESTDLTGRLPYIYVSPLDELVVSPSSFNVGIAWRSGDWNARRSLPAEILHTLTIPGVTFWSLQYPPEPSSLGASQLGCKDIYMMAQRMQQLDAIVSVDTMVAHLAGALGLRTFLLLGRDADWRWQHRRCDSPWYPSMQLIRQRATDWIEPIEVLRAHLALDSKATAALDTRSVGCRAFSD